MTLASRHLAKGLGRMVLAALALIQCSCNQRVPILDGTIAPTAPSVVSAPSNVVRIVFNPPGNRGGTTGSGTVYLDAPAPDSGRVIDLRASDESILTLSPRQLTVPPGSLSANFQFITRAVTRDVNVTITASSGDGFVSDSLVVWAPSTSFLSYSAEPSQFATPGPVGRWSTDANARFVASCFDNSVSVEITAPGRFPVLLSFSAPRGHALRTGSFDIPADSENANSMFVSAAGNCWPKGRFEVHEIETRADRTLSNLWLTFELSCNLKPGIMRGAFSVVDATPRTPSNRCLR